RVHDFQLGVESYQQKVNLTAPIIIFSSIEKYKVFSIVSEPVYGIIYKNNKKEKRVVRHQEIYKFCDATLKRVLEGLKSYNNDVKHGYVTPSLSKEDVEYLQLFEEEIEERLKHRDQMRHWEIESFGFFHQYFMIGNDVASTGENNDFWIRLDMRILREIEFQKDLVLEDFKSFVESVVEENSFGVENFLSWIV
nr:hypothetical protein [Tanacetum cinerariifolium]